MLMEQNIAAAHQPILKAKFERFRDSFNDAIDALPEEQALAQPHQPLGTVNAPLDLTASLNLRFPTSLVATVRDPALPTSNQTLDEDKGKS